MKRKHFSIDRMTAALEQTELSTAVGELGISERTFYGFRRRCAGLQSGQLKELKQLQNENTRLKKLVTELRLDKSILKSVARLCSTNKLSS